MVKSMNSLKLEFAGVAAVNLAGVAAVNLAGVAAVNFRRIKQIFSITGLREKSLSNQQFAILSVISQPKSALESPICVAFT